MLLELLIKGVTEYSVCSRSFSEAVEDALLKSIEEATDCLSDNSDTSSTSLSPILALASEIKEIFFLKFEIHTHGIRNFLTVGEWEGLSH